MRGVIRCAVAHVLASPLQTPDISGFINNGETSNRRSTTLVNLVIRLCVECCANTSDHLGIHKDFSDTREALDLRQWIAPYNSPRITLENIPWG